MREDEAMPSPEPKDDLGLATLTHRPRLSAVDLFSGAGGASLGIVQADYDLRLAAEIVPSYADTHEANLPGHCLRADLRLVDSSRIMEMVGVGAGELDLLFAGPPCQGFSMIGKRVVWDERNNLFSEVLRIGRDIRPRAIVIENVPGLLTLGGGAYLRSIMSGLRGIGYVPGVAELLAAQYGAPQMRWRLVIVAWRDDLTIPAGYGFPAPTHGSSRIGELVLNRKITDIETDGFVTAGEALADLPPIAAGEQGDKYLGPPTSEYQVQMRKGLTEELFNHYSARLSSQNLERIRHLRPGQDWRDLPFELLPFGMQRALRKDHTRRFRRMTWSGIPRSVITRFRDPKTGEYTHPEQDRTISIREAARLQGFPDSFRFYGDKTSQYEQVGNAVPVQLAQAVAAEVARCLDGRPGERLRDPFRRRPVADIGMNGELLEVLRVF